MKITLTTNHPLTHLILLFLFLVTPTLHLHHNVLTMAAITLLHLLQLAPPPMAPILTQEPSP